MSFHKQFTDRVLEYWSKCQEVHHPSVITHKSELTNDRCNDNVYVEASIDAEGYIRELSMFPRSCCICAACCMLAAEVFIGARLEDVKGFVDDSGWLAAVKLQFGCELPEDRYTCASLSFLALKALTRC